MSDHRRFDSIPEVRVVRQPGEPRRTWSRRPLSARVVSAFEPLREPAANTVRTVVGLWPLFAIILLAGGLIYSAAMGASP